MKVFIDVIIWGLITSFVISLFLIKINNNYDIIQSDAGVNITWDNTSSEVAVLSNTPASQGLMTILTIEAANASNYWN